MHASFPLLSLNDAPTDGVAEVQTLTPGGTIGGGTFTLTYDGDETAAIAWDATPSDVQDALEALDALDGNVTVEGDDPDTPTILSAGGVYTVTFVGSLAGRDDIVELTADDGSLTGKTPTVAVAVDTAGVLGSFRGAPGGALLEANTGVGFIYENTGTSTVPVWTLFSNVGS